MSGHSQIQGVYFVEQSGNFRAQIRGSMASGRTVPPTSEKEAAEA